MPTDPYDIEYQLHQELDYGDNIQEEECASDDYGNSDPPLVNHKHIPVEIITTDVTLPFLITNEINAGNINPENYNPENYNPEKLGQSTTVQSQRKLANDFLDGQIAINLTTVIAVLAIILFWLLLCLICRIVKSKRSGCIKISTGSSDEELIAINVATSTELPKRCSFKVSTCRLGVTDSFGIQ